MISLRRFVVIFSNFLLPVRVVSLFKINNNISKVHIGADGVNFNIFILGKGGLKYFLYSVVRSFDSGLHICRSSW